MRLRTFGGLWIEGTPPVPALGPRRLALLALVAAAGRRGLSRDRAIGILWPDAEQELARHTLSQAIYTLRRDTGRDWIVAGNELKLAPEISSDVGELKEAEAAGGHEAVVALAAGAFLEGFYLQGAPEFERWVEEERARIHNTLLRALEQLAARAEAAGEPAAALAWWTRLSEADPLNARYAAGRMRMLAGVGDRASALAHARAYEELVRRELEAEVDPAIRKLVTTLRANDSPEAAPAPWRPPPHPVPAPSSAPALKDARTDPAPEPIRRWRWLVPAAAAVLLGASVFLLRPSDAPAVPFLAVGEIRTAPGEDSTRASLVIRDMLATSLGGIEGLQVVANSRLVEMLARENDSTPGVTSAAARRAGATEIIEGELTPEAGGLVLSLRRVGLARGEVRKGYVIRARDRYTAVDSAASAIARDLALLPPSGSVSEIRTSSPAAYALYDEGLRAYFGYDAPAAYRLMKAALVQDSSFAMAAYYIWRLSVNFEPESVSNRAMDVVRRLAARTIERERLLLLGLISEFGAPLADGIALAETLTVKYPTDPDGQILLGGVRGREGDWLGSVAALERAVALDLSAEAHRGPYCRICAATWLMSGSYLWADSAAAAIRVARRFLTIRPQEVDAHRTLIEPLLRQGRPAEALEAWNKSQGPPEQFPFDVLRRDLIRWGRYHEADSVLTEAAMGRDRHNKEDARWLLLLSLRDQGRLREAEQLIRHARLPNSLTPLPDVPGSREDLVLLAMERGNPAPTIRVHRENAVGASNSATPIGHRTRAVVWNLVLAGTAHHAAGDTAVVRRLADSVEVLGRLSAFGRDHRLHLVLRGLQLQGEGRHAEAVDAFRRSLFSPTDGYTRTNLMMARSLLALRRPTEAIAVLRPAIHGGVDGSNSYVSRTELHEAMAEAFEQAGRADSATAHWRAVESAWRRADPQFRERYARARLKAGL